MSELGKKPRKAVTPFNVEVMGGVFTVQEIVLSDVAQEAQVMMILKETPADRWFVMLQEEGPGTLDILALINENFDFNTYAVGQFKGE